MKIAVIGAGIAGLGCAHALRNQADVTVYEADTRLGGHTHTVDVCIDGIDFAVDTGFLVYNERTYPRLIQLFSELEVPIAKSDMSFGVSVPLEDGARLEWAGSDLGTVFAQRRNLTSPRFLSMLADILRFNAQATRIAQGSENTETQSLGEFLDRHRYGTPFRQWYLLPMAAAIWSCPIATMLAYPITTFAHFCHNHGLLQITGRPQWFTVRGGARQYVQKIAGQLADVRAGEAVHEVRRTASSHIAVASSSGMAEYDQVVLACHSDQSLRMLADADSDQRAVLAAIGYQDNRAILHTDVRLMPERRKVWSAWNYLSNGEDTPLVSVTYLLNKLQPLPVSTPLLLSLNPLLEPRPETVIATIDYAHPVFDAAAIAAQQRLSGVQGRNGVWLAGAWTGYGFHEDGLKSGLAVADQLRHIIAQGPARRAA